MDILWKVLLLQGVVLGIIFVVLRMMFEKELWLAAMGQLTRLDFDQHKLVKPVVIVTVKEINPDRRERVIQLMKRKCPTAEIEFRHDASLRGGVVIYFNEEKFDFSVQSRLSQLWKK